MKPTSSTRHFTLIELLVVVAIISVLASMLLPVLGKARGKARQTVCASNLKQMFLAQAMYEGDMDGFVPSRTYTEAYKVAMPYSGWNNGYSPYSYIVAAGYIDSFHGTSKYALKESPATSCPDFWPQVPESITLWQGGGANAGNNAHTAGTTYSFNAHLDTTMTVTPISSGKVTVLPYGNILRPAERWIYTTGAHVQMRTNSASAANVANGTYVWWAHNGNTTNNFLFVDGHLQGRNHLDFPYQVGYAGTYGKDTALPSPW